MENSSGNALDLEVLSEQELADLALETLTQTVAAFSMSLEMLADAARTEAEKKSAERALRLRAKLVALWSPSREHIRRLVHCGAVPEVDRHQLIATLREVGHALLDLPPYVKKDR